MRCFLNNLNIFKGWYVKKGKIIIIIFFNFILSSHVDKSLMFEMVHMCDWSNTRNLKIKTIKNQNAGQTTQTILDLLIIIIIIIGEKKWVIVK